MEKAVLEREKDSVEKEFNQNRDILEKLSNDVRALTALNIIYSVCSALK